MAKLEQLMEQQAAKLGTTWTAPVSLKTLIEQDRVRIAGTDNALLMEIDGEAYTLPDSWRLSFFE